MLRFPSLPSIFNFCAARRGFGVVCLTGALLTLLASASAQNFTITMAAFDPFTVNPGIDSSANMSFVAGAGLTGTVSLSCQVTSNISSPVPPSCQVIPPTVQSTQNVVVTITTTGNTTPGTYTVIVTGTGSSGPPQQTAQTITVQAVSPEFTITIQSAVLPTSVHAGSGGIGTVNVNPVFGYIGDVTMSCASITPLVTIPPVCQFSPNPVPVNGATAQTNVSIITYGPIPTGAVSHPRSYYALWLPLPLMLLAGVGAATSGKRTRKAWAMLALFILGGSLLLVPACSSNATVSKTTPNGITPNGTYHFTLQGVDANGNISSNTGTANTAPTITLTVD